ncbi:UbiA family prenyltransferase [Streptomyces sp. XD-27]|uniref:UbiA family prenyltransferase n=1 Tax=Streptomyces sp. XD-27 TaxID=3062779 RepID=UPI0026F444A1|nr:UbiA family prenyltransferase [Streptomyces sp. XD-27]WKX69515.1 UbiA family prenyltransferase [Streptomyces sp. XD-27]
MRGVGAEARREAGTGAAARACLTRPRPAAVQGLLGACHPLPALAVTVMATALGIACGHSWQTCALVGLAVLSGQLSIGWSNDWLDARRDLATGRADKPVVTGRVGPRAVGCASAAALTACVPLSLAAGLPAAAAHLFGVTGGWLYNLGLKRTVWSWLGYAMGFGSLPAFVVLALPGHPRPTWWTLAVGALLGVGAHIANVLPDIPDDLATGVRGLPQRLGATGARLLAPLPLLAGIAVLAFAPPGPAGAAGWFALAAGTVLTAAGIVHPARGSRSRAPFLTAIAVAAIAVALAFSRAASMTCPHAPSVT